MPAHVQPVSAASSRSSASTERLVSNSMASCSPACSLAQPPLRRPMRHPQRRADFAIAAKRGKRGQGGGNSGTGLGLLQIEPDGSNMWRLTAAVDSIESGGVGIIPTDTFPAFVCDLADKAAVQRLYWIKGLSPTQPLSILCASFADISTYTQGFPAANSPGQPDLFRIARQILPGPYTFIMLASKALPKQCVDYLSGKSKTRRSVGVRMPDDAICQAVLEQLQRPLLCSSIRPEDQLSGALPDAAVLLDEFGPRGLDFVVDDGRKFAEGSTVVDMTSNPPKVLRRGLGDSATFEAMAEELVPA